MPNFSHCRVASWRDGELPKELPVHYAVSFDQKKDVYAILPSEYAEFVEWVAAHWEQDSDMWQDGEEAADYLLRVGISISEA